MRPKSLLMYVLSFSTSLFPNSAENNQQVPGYLFPVLIVVVLLILANLISNIILLKKHHQNQSGHNSFTEHIGREGSSQNNDLLFAQNVDISGMIDKKLEGQIKPISELLNELRSLAYSDPDFNETYNFHFQRKMNEVIDKIEILQQMVDSHDKKLRDIAGNLKEIQLPPAFISSAKGANAESQREPQSGQNTGRKF